MHRYVDVGGEEGLSWWLDEKVKEGIRTTGLRVDGRQVARGAKVEGGREEGEEESVYRKVLKRAGGIEDLILTWIPRVEGWDILNSRGLKGEHFVSTFISSLWSSS